MIKTEQGETTMKGTRAEIATDLRCILQAAFDEAPLLLLIALEMFIEPNAQVEDEDGDAETKMRIKALALALSQLPKEELEALKKKAEEVKDEEKRVRCIDCRCKQQQFTGQAVPKFICTSSIWKELGRALHVIDHDMYKPIYCDHFEKEEENDGTDN